MTSFYALSNDRLLTIIPHGDVQKVIKNQTRKSIFALLTLHKIDKCTELEPIILSLLDNGCEYFVCFGIESEVLHDRIDDFIVERMSNTDDISNTDDTVITTWHNKDTIADIVDFFLNIAGTKQNSFLIAVLGSEDKELANLLIKEAST